MSISKQQTIAILGYASTHVPVWDPDIVNTGIGGSEEAIIYACQNLVDRGYSVTVFANPPPHSRWSLEVAKPRYLHMQHFLQSRQIFDIVICWRRSDFATARTRGRRIFAWYHDMPEQPRPDSYLHDPYLNGTFYLSRYHQELFEQVYPTRRSIPKVIAGNGIVANHIITELELTTKPRTSCIYISNWARGLELLLQIWPSIRNTIPSATLDIYYGTQTWGLWTPAKTTMVVKQINEMKHLGVTNHGMVGHPELDQALIKSSIWTYPCNCGAETYCISAIKAQYWGNIPLTTRPGALTETVSPEATFVSDLSQYGSHLIRLLTEIQNMSTYDLLQKRRVFIDFAAHHTWAACVDKWMTLF